MNAFLAGGVCAFVVMAAAVALFVRRTTARMQRWAAVTRRDLHRGLAQVELVVPRRRGREIDSELAMARFDELLAGHGECGESTSGPRRHVFVATGESTSQLIAQGIRLAEELGASSNAYLRIYESDSTTFREMRVAGPRRWHRGSEPGQGRRRP